MATFFWGVPPGKSGAFGDINNWFNTGSQLFGDGRPRDDDTANVVGAVLLPPQPNSPPPVPVHLVIAPGQTATVARLQVMFQSTDEDLVWIEGNLRVLDEIFFENDRGNLRFMGTITLDGTTDAGGLLSGATMDVDFLRVGGSPISSSPNSVTVDDNGMFEAVRGAEVTTRRLEVLGTGEFVVSGGSTVKVAGAALIQQDVGATEVSVGGRSKDGVTGSSLLIDGDLLLDGVLEITDSGRGKAGNVEISSTSIASLNVGDSPDGNVSSRFNAQNITLGNGHSRGGTLFADTDGQIFIAHTLNLLDFPTGGSTFSAEVSTGGGFIEIGPRPDLLLEPDYVLPGPDTISIRPDGLSFGLIGHGLVETGTLQNAGRVAAQGGLLLVHANVTGIGIFYVDTNSTLEIDGSFASTATVSLSGSFSTLALDAPASFKGKITSIDLTDTIRLNGVGSAFGNAVKAAAIAPDATGNQLLYILQDTALLKYDVEDGLAGSRVVISPSGDGKSTSLTIAPHGSVTTSYLDAAGKTAVTFKSGDGSGENTDVFIELDGTPTIGDSGDAASSVFYDYTNQQLNAYKHDWIASNGEKAYFHVTYDNSKLAPLKAGIDVQLPSAPDASQTHNLWYSFRHGGLASITYDDGFGHFGTEDSVGHFVDATFVRGLVTTIASAPPVPPGGAAIASLPASDFSSEAPIAANTSLPSLPLTLVSQVWDRSTKILTAFTTQEYSFGNLDTVSSWVRNGDGSYTRTDTHPGVPTAPFVSEYSVFIMTSNVLPRLGLASSPIDPIMASVGQGLVNVNVGGLLIGRHGESLSTISGLPVQGAVLVSDNGAALIGQDGAGVIGNDGAGLAATDAARLVGQDAAGIVAGGGGNIVAGGGGNIVAGGGGNIVAGGGGNLTSKLGAEGGSKVVDAGSGNAFTLSGTGTPGRYVANALVFADSDGNGKLDNGEAWTVTDASGRFQLFGGWGTLVLTGGTDTGTNLPFTATLTSPLGSTDISSLTTLASGLADDDGNIDGAIAQLQTALGLDTKLDFTVIDPIASTENGDASSAKIYVETAKTMDTVFLIGAAFAGLGADQSMAQQAAFGAMVDAINKSGTLNLSDEATVDGLIVAVGTKLGADAGKIADAVAGSIASTSQLLDKLLLAEGAGTDLTNGITMIETGVQGALVSSLKAAGGDPGKLGPAALLLQATSDDGKNVVTPGHVVTITMTTSEAVTVSGAPTLHLGNGKLAMFAGGSGSSALVFKYTVQAGDGNGASELQVTGLTLAAGATIKDASGNNLASTVAGSLGLEIDAGAVASIAATDAVKAEGQGGTTPFTFTVTRSGDTTVSHSASWVVTGSGPTQADGPDFAGGVLPSGTVTFAAGETSRTITLDVVGSNGVEPDEGFKVSLSNPTSGLVIGTASAVGTILNDDATVSVGAVSAVKAEGNGVTTSFTFNLAVGGDISVPHTVSYAVVGAGINPASEADFAGGVLPGGTVTFAAGESSRVISIEVIGDSVVEADESFAVELSNPSVGLQVGAASAAGTIVGDDASMSIVAQNAEIAEGDSGATLFTFVVTRTGSLAAAHSVSWSMVGSGVEGADPSDIGGTALNGGTLSFAIGETTKTIEVAVIGDAEIEFDEAFEVSLNNPSAGLNIGTASAVSTILNDDRSVASIAALSMAKAEENSGTTPFTFTVTLDKAGVTAQTVDWSVTGSPPTAADGSDFGGTLPSGTATFAAGETSKTIVLPVSGDTVVEPDNFFSVSLSSPSAGVLLGTTSAGGIIQNDDRAVLSISALSAALAEGNSGTTSFTFTVSLDQASFEGQTATWAVTGSGANAANAADFGGALPSGVVSFAAGETSKAVTISVAGDTSVEFDESFAVTLSIASAGLLLGTASASGTILNDDRSTVSIAAQSAVKAEGNAGTTASTFVISLSQAGVAAQTVSWAVAGAGINPASAADFAGGVLPGGIVTFAPGETSKVVTVTATGDSVVEPDEGYGVTLSGLSGGLVAGVASAAGTIQNDDVAVAVTAHNDAYVVLRGQSLTATASVLSNDVAGTTATLLSGPAHGTLQLAGNGTFTYAAAAGFVGIDSFTYRAGNGGSTDDGQVHVHVVPVNAGTSTTLNLLSLTAEEQIASTYAAFFGRGADMGGFGFWVGEFNRLLPTQGASALFANIASSFGISDEAKALYPFLVSPFTATDGQISAFLDSVYNNLFNRSSDAGGLGYWTDQIKQTLQAGQFVGSILVNIMSGAQETAVGKDITTLMGKVAVSLAFVREQEEHHTVWAGASDTAAATTLLQAVTADPLSVLVGVRNAELLIAGHA